MISIWALPAVAAAEEESKLMSWLATLGRLRSRGVPEMSADGPTWGDLSFLERVKVYDWTTEVFVLLTFVVFLVSYVVGRKINKSKVDGFYEAVKPLLDEQFGYVGASRSQLIVKDSDTRYSTYASGRVNIESLLARFRLIDRQNVMNYTLGLFVPAMASPDGQPDHIEITLTPTDQRSIEPGIFSIANKENLARIQPEYYFLQLTNAVDSSELPSPTYIFLHEHSDQASLLFTPKLREALALEGADRVFQFIAYSDVPASEPKKEKDISNFRKVVLTLNYPSTPAQYEAARHILAAALDLVDTLVEKPAYRPTTAKRIKATREKEAARIKKADEQLKKEEIEAKKAEERREAARRERNLSEKEQRKLQKKEQEKQARKNKQRMTRKN